MLKEKQKGVTRNLINCAFVLSSLYGGMSIVYNVAATSCFNKKKNQNQQNIKRYFLN